MKKLVFLFCLLFFFFAVETVIAQNDNVFEPKNVVMKIEKDKNFLVIKFERFGTGWCLDPKCSFVISNYHVAKLVGNTLKINGEKVVNTFLATGPEDEGSVVVGSPSGFLFKCNPSRDIAIFSLERPLASKGMHGIDFSLQRLQKGEEISVYAHPGGGKLAKFLGKFLAEYSDGILEFEVQRSEDGKVISPGASGGLIVNKKNQAVGLLWGMSGNKAYAISVWSLANFIKKIEPEIYAKLFLGEVYRPDISSPVYVDTMTETAYGASPKPVLPKMYIQWLGELALPFLPENSDALRRRGGESTDIQSLRKKAQAMVDGMKNFIAIQTLTHFNEDKIEMNQYEVQVVDNSQVFRRLSDGKETLLLPYPTAGGVEIGGEWSHLPNMVGNNLKLRIDQVGERNIDDHKIKIYRYKASEEDNACFLRLDGWIGPVACDGEVWTDENHNIVRITQNLKPPAAKTEWREFRLAVTYGFLENKLLPTDIVFQAKLGGKTSLCTGSFTNYRTFSASSKLSFD